MSVAFSLRHIVERKEGTLLGHAERSVSFVSSSIGHDDREVALNNMNIFSPPVPSDARGWTYYLSSTASRALRAASSSSSSRPGCLFCSGI